jgi:hypothetical protein
MTAFFTIYQQPHRLSLSRSKSGKKIDWMIAGWMDISHLFLPFSSSCLLIRNVQHGGTFYHFPHHPFLSGMCNMVAFFTIFLIMPCNQECAIWRHFLAFSSSRLLIRNVLTWWPSCRICDKHDELSYTSADLTAMEYL